MQKNLVKNLVNALREEDERLFLVPSCPNFSGTRIFHKSLAVTIIHLRRHGAKVITTEQLHASKPELRLCMSS